MSGRMVRVLLTVTLGLGMAWSAAAQEGQGSQPGPETQAMMAAWAKAGTPGPEHRQLAKMEGTWDLKVKFWMPGVPEPQTSTATSTMRMILGGRFLHEQVQGEAMGGEKFEGAGITGYDNMQQRYVSVWTDNMSTALLMSAGHCSEDRSSCTYFSEAWDPALQTLKVTKAVERGMGPDNRVVQFFDTSPDGSEHPIMELTYTRRKAVQ